MARGSARGMARGVPRGLPAGARANLYAFFSRIFVRELDDAAVALLRGPLGAELLPAFSASEELALVADAAQRVAVFDADFAHLTIVNVVPYGSFYSSPTAMMTSGTAAGVGAFLREIGLEVDLGAARSLATDHVGIVLEAMAKLCAAEAEAEARPDLVYAKQISDLQIELLREHALPWLPLYFFAVERCAHTKLYGEAARVAMDFVASDYTQLRAQTAASDSAPSAAASEGRENPANPGDQPATP